MVPFFFFFKNLLAHKTSLYTLGQYVKCSTQQGTWEKLVSDRMSKVLSELVTSFISKRFNLMLPNVILILIRFHYVARSSLYSTERRTVKSFGRSTGTQSLSSPVAQSPCCSVRTTVKRTKGRLQHAPWKKWLEHVLSKPRSKEGSLHL